ncbi:hypothetical protein V6N11_035415 [Hibiscus sabdariffa]|uniref:Cytochrome P450 n=1 Tax=Hibiscus sabdariffa TaxID=183260 RepID=A0ABR2R089_9ROSI
MNTLRTHTSRQGCNDIAFDSYSSPNWKNKHKVLASELLTTARLNAYYGLRREQVMKAISGVFKNIGKPIDIGKLAFLVATNATISIILGGKFRGEKGDTMKDHFKDISSELMELIGKPNVSDIFPAVARLSKEINQSLNELLESVIQVATEEEKNEEKLGFLQLLLHLEGKNNEDNASSLTMNQVKGLLAEIVIGGTDTTTTMVEWTMAKLIQHLKILEKTKNDLTNVVGLNNVVEESHLPNLRYLNAVTKETFRLHPALPLLVPRYSAESRNLGGYNIPKGSKVFLNMWSIHRDSHVWDNPLEFKPERFLNDVPGKFDYFGNDFRFMPFGSGRRKCSGLPLAEKMLYLILASMLHSFEWKLP